VIETKLFNVTQSIKACSPAPATEGMEVCPTEITCADSKGVWVPNAGLKVACNAVPSLGTTAKTLPEDVIGTLTNHGFWGGVSSGQEFGAAVSVGKDNTLNFAGNIQVPAEHQGKEADLLFVVAMVAPDKPYSTDATAIYMAYDGTKTGWFPTNLYGTGCPPYYGNCSNWTWEKELAKLTVAPFKSKVTLGKSVNMELFKGKLGDAGETQGKFYIFFGYALVGDGTVVYNSVPVMAELTK